MIREGKLDEARQMCEEQTSGALGQLQADPEWRKEYLELWMHQRPPPFRITFDDFDFDGQQHLLCCAVLCCVVLCCAVLCYTVICTSSRRTVFCDGVNWHAKLAERGTGGRA